MSRLLQQTFTLSAHFIHVLSLVQPLWGRLHDASSMSSNRRASVVQSVEQVSRTVVQVEQVVQSVVQSVVQFEQCRAKCRALSCTVVHCRANAPKVAAQGLKTAQVYISLWVGDLQLTMFPWPEPHTRLRVTRPGYRIPKRERKM